MRSSVLSSTLFPALVAITLSACGGSGFTAGAASRADADAGAAGEDAYEAGQPGQAGSTGEDGGKPGAGGSAQAGGSPSGGGAPHAGQTGVSGSTGEAGAPQSGSGGAPSGGAPSGGASSGGSGSASGAAGTVTDGPYDGCARDYVSSSCTSSDGNISFKYQCGAGVDPSGCEYDQNHVAVCVCKAVPFVPGAFCCGRNSLSCQVSPSIGAEGKCTNVNGPSHEMRPYLYSGCNVSGNPSPDNCTKVSGGEYCCSDSFLK